MANPHSRDSRDEVKISIALVVEKVLLVTMMNKQWFLVVVEIKLRHVFLSISQNLLIWDSVIGRRGKVAMRQGREPEDRSEGKRAYHLDISKMLFIDLDKML